MKFLTECRIPDPGFSISHKHGIVLIGSCFTDNIGRKLSQNKFSVTVNPYGILYNPRSIEICISNTINSILPEEPLLINTGSVWYSFLHHGSIYALSKNALTEKIAAINTQTLDVLKKCACIFITLGTSFVYALQNGLVIANCHKKDASQFSRSLLSFNSICGSLQNIIDLLLSINKTIKIIFTVSPVIHLKDGLIQNNRSKSLLCAAIGDVCDAHKSASYFPSYEIVTSVLRDYRFYTDDLAHPSPAAVEYIWEKFSDLFFETETKELCSKIMGIQKSVEHKPFFPESEEYKNHTKRTLKSIELLEKKYPYISFKTEKLLLKQ